MGLSYRYSVHVDEESLGSVADEKKVGQPGGFFARWWGGGSVLLREKGREKDQAAGVEEEEPETRSWFKADELVSSYAVLQDDSDVWYNI